MAKNVVSSIAQNQIKKTRRTDQDRFLDELRHLMSSQNVELVTNQSLRDKLNWDKEKYDRLRIQYLNEGTIVPGKGHGGKIGIPAAPIQPLKLFISYSHKDKIQKIELEKHLKPLLRKNLIQIWSDGEINAGTEWNKEIVDKLSSADIIILIISVDFINSEFCYDKELEMAMERHDSGSACVIPILLRNCIWNGTLFAKLQAIPSGSQPIMAWPIIDDGYVNTVEEIQKSAEKFRTMKRI